MTTTVINKDLQAEICLNLTTQNFVNCPISFESGNLVKEDINYWYTRATCSKCGIEEYTEDTYTACPLPYNSLNMHLVELNEQLNLLS